MMMRIIRFRHVIARPSTTTTTTTTTNTTTTTTIRRFLASQQQQQRGEPLSDYVKQSRNEQSHHEHLLQQLVQASSGPNQWTVEHSIMMDDTWEWWSMQRTEESVLQTVPLLQTLLLQQKDSSFWTSDKLNRWINNWRVVSWNSHKLPSPETLLDWIQGLPVLNEKSLYLILEAGRTPELAQRVWKLATSHEHLQPSTDLCNLILQHWPQHKVIVPYMTQHHIPLNANTWRLLIQQATVPLAWFEFMVFEYEQQKGPPPNAACCMAVLETSPGPEAEQAWKWMQSQLSLQAFLPPPLQALHTILRNSTPERALELFRQQQRKQPKPNATTFLILMQTTFRHDPHQVQTLWDELVVLYQASGADRLQPTPAHVTAVMDAWARSHDPHKWKRMTTVLQHVQQQLTSIPILSVPTYNTMLRACLEPDGGSTTTSGRSSIWEAQQILDEWIVDTSRECRPDTISYSTVIQGWAQRGHAQRAMELLDRMIADENCQPDVRAFNAVLSAYSKSNQPPEQAEGLLIRMQQLGLEPDVYSYTAVIASLARASRPGAAAAQYAPRAHHWLQTMPCPPTVVSYNAVLNAYASAGQPQRVGQILLNEMSSTTSTTTTTTTTTTAPRPDVWSFNAWIKAWIVSKRPESCLQAEAIVARMRELNVVPNETTYAQLILCYKLSRKPGAPQRAEEILRLMDQLHRSGQLKVGPNATTYQNVRKAWLMSNEAEKLERAEALLQESHERFGKPVATPPKEKSSPGRMASQAS